MRFFPYSGLIELSWMSFSFTASLTVSFSAVQRAAKVQKGRRVDIMDCIESVFSIAGTHFGFR